MTEPQDFDGISVVIPVLNEAQIFPELLSRLKKTAEASSEKFEWIFVDDGSTDSTPDLIRQAASDDDRVKYLCLSRNFGHQLAVSAGLDHASGNAVIVMDGDLQDPPELFDALIAGWREGNEVVYAVRKTRQENILLKSCYSIFYKILARISEVQIPKDSGDFCLMDRKIVTILKEMPERNRFIRGIRAWAGYRQVGVEYDRDKRFAGKAKYSIGRLIKLAFDGITSFSDLPLRLCGYIGIFLSAASSLGLFYSLISKWFFDATPQGWASVVFAVFFLGGIQLLMLSFVGIYIGRIYKEVQGRPLYLVKDTNLHR